MSRGIVPLTIRQRQLLSLVAGGYSSTQAARTLGISAQTGALPHRRIPISRRS